MRIGKWCLSVLVMVGLAVLLAAPSATVMVGQEKGGGEVTGPYEYVPNWPNPDFFEKGWTWGSIPAVWAESADRVLVFMRGEFPSLKPVSQEGGIKGYMIGMIEAVLEQSKQKSRWQHLLMAFDRNGKLIETWDQLPNLLDGVHRVQISPYDPEKSVWLVDHSGHQVLKFTHDGKKLLMKLGEKGVPGNDKGHFNRPSDLAFMPNGDVFICDGYVGTRVVKFSKDGKYLMEWGKGGTGPGEFQTVHGIAIDAKRRIYVGDRENARIQVFDENGKFIEIWPNVPHPYFLYMAKDQHLWVGDGVTHKVLKFDLTGKLLYSWGTFGRMPGNLWGPHQLNVDNEGNLYVANAQGNNVVKFRPKKGADPEKLVGQPFILPMTSGQ